MAQLLNSFTDACSNAWYSFKGTLNAGFNEVVKVVTPRKRPRPSSVSASPTSSAPPSPTSSASAPPNKSAPVSQTPTSTPHSPPHSFRPASHSPRKLPPPPHTTATINNNPLTLPRHRRHARQHFFRRSYAALNAAAAPTPFAKPSAPASVPAPRHPPGPPLRKTVHKRRPLTAHRRLAATRALAKSTRTHPKLYQTHPSPRLNSVLPSLPQKTPPHPPSQRDPSSPKSDPDALPSPSQRAAQLAHLPPSFANLFATDSRLSNKLWKVHHKRIQRLASADNNVKALELSHFVARQKLDQLRRLQEQNRRIAALRHTVPKPKPLKPQSERPPPRAAHFYNHNYWLPPNRDAFDYHLQPPQKHHAAAVTVTDPQSAFAPLTDTAVARLQAIFADPSNQHQELSRVDGCIIRGEDLRTLKPNNWLNDEVVNAYMNLIAARAAKAGKKSSSDENAKPNGHPNDLSNGYGLSRFHTSSPSKSLLSSSNYAPRVKVISSFFYSTLFKFNPHTRVTEYNYSRVKRWTRRFDVFDYDIMLIPINHQNMHWTLGVIDFKNKTVAHLDSMGKGGSPEVRENLLRWVRDEAATKEHELNDQEWSTDDVIVPQQTNSDDCGVFLCKYADFLSRGWSDFTFSQDHMNYFRARIAHELLMKKA
ncbi:Sentrin-specific protease 1 [Gracilariopsis chorda]|uniref:Sentrin-specific protease 1 n=1 Tax=Gracilariopsis chorda TaxID=448386 RepID=A0A2V3IXJ6_9FLOR|nr:Sentrin-specific protease 1 [Gracilariopsis chorda]|eukprot:PXF46785.1 Sentrin-specific protease 1 [Gracilariopsis chorda]